MWKILPLPLLLVACAQEPVVEKPLREWTCRSIWVDKSGEKEKFTAIASANPEKAEVKDTKGWYRDPKRTDACISRDAPRKAAPKKD